MRKLTSEELGRPDAEQFRRLEKMPAVAVLDNIRSLHNVGSIFRSADAFALKAIYLCGITACPPHREIHKTALGATETVEWHYYPQITDCLKQLAAEGYEIVCVEQTNQSIKLQDFAPSRPVALVFGNELDGVSDAALQWCQRAVELPQAGTKHSLNVSVCAGIVFWHLFNLTHLDKK
ncbi:MAG: RNA methyltransferase [Bacteroidetes bacterium]|nr:RNA methyltransferase [Bacteroidota bacterium]